MGEGGGGDEGRGQEEASRVAVQVPQEVGAGGGRFLGRGEWGGRRGKRGWQQNALDMNSYDSLRVSTKTHETHDNACAHGGFGAFHSISFQFPFVRMRFK